MTDWIVLVVKRLPVTATGRQVVRSVSTSMQPAAAWRRLTRRRRHMLLREALFIHSLQRTLFRIHMEDGFGSGS